MEKKYFVLYLIPNRPDFAQTMTDDERNIMKAHIAYWSNYLEQGIMLVFGPVFDQKETYGLGIITVDDEEQLLSLLKNDPASVINHYEHYPMRAATKK
jgi:uncharacterized protein YciI